MNAPIVKGQWLGNVNGTNRGMIIINLDSHNDCYKGRVFILDQDKPPIMVANIHVIGSQSGVFKGDLTKFTPLDSSDLPMAQNETFPHLPNTATCEFSLINSTLRGKWSTNISTYGNFTAVQAFDWNLTSDKNKHFNSQVLTWKEFTANLQTNKKEGYIYRGQPDIFKLRSTYHRTGRSDLIRYIREDVPELKNQLDTYLNYSFNLDDEHEYAALLYLAQHHGYPTPLLDWTKSPYVAAYFAFENNPISNGYVSIFEFNSRSWLEKPDNFQTKEICCWKPSLRLITPTPLFNPRAQPQKSIAMFSNLDGIQEWISQKELDHNTEYLRIIRIKASERKIVLDELYSMGIHSASLFPGLDGICKSLKQRNF